ncbi:MAG: flagellar basal body-associated FliL family protein [Sterolibacterium sp.]|jgi:flagellar FliL protein|nr:flagellar basal body-associated FliL family protein [Sterolibacterium sp.]
MAKAPEKAEANEAAAPPAKSKKTLIIIIVAVVLVLVIGAAMILMKKSHPPAEGEEGKTEKVEKAKKKPDAPPIVVKLDQFTVKLQPDEGKPEQYMQTTAEMEVQDNAAAEHIKVYMSRIRAKILLILLGKTPSEISTPQGIELLTTEIRNEVNTILDGTVRPPGTLKAGEDDAVRAVYLTQFIVQ